LIDENVKTEIDRTLSDFRKYITTEVYFPR
jgi:hypothetical protein